jgi:hypothetical protein
MQRQVRIQQLSSHRYRQIRADGNPHSGSSRYSPHRRGYCMIHLRGFTAPLGDIRIVPHHPLIADELPAAIDCPTINAPPIRVMLGSSDELSAALMQLVESPEIRISPVHCIGGDFRVQDVRISDVCHKKADTNLDRPTGSSAPENMSLRERGDGGPRAGRHRFKKARPRVLQ